MNRLSGLADTLLSAKLAPRLELLALQQSQVGTDAATGPVVQVQKVVNDPRLPPELALGRSLPAGVPLPAAPPGANVPASATAQLSAAARAIGALLAEFPDAGPLRGTAPIWPSPQAPSSTVLAGTLARTVGVSGLFYESHLREFVEGTRTLAQLAQEPQARWAPPRSAAPEASAQPVAVAAAVVLAAEAPKPSLPVAAMPGAVAVAAEPDADDAAPASAAPRAPAAAGESDAVLPSRAPPPPVHADALVPATDATRVQAAYRRGEAVLFAPEAAPLQRAEEPASRHAAAAAVQAAPAGEVIHPQAATVVHQQLDLLATAVFRWSGQAWPEVPMTWTIQEEGADPESGAADEPAPRRWSTTVSLSLPRLGEVELRLSLTGPMVQAQLSASEAATAARLRTDSGALTKRLEAAGLRLQALQINAASERP